VYYSARPSFRIAELQISPSPKVPWHYHNIIQDTFYVVEGTLRIFLQEPKEEVRLTRPAARSAPRSAQREGADYAFDVGDSAQWSRNRFDLARAVQSIAEFASASVGLADFWRTPSVRGNERLAEGD
jgi:hypothetical protein